MCIPVFDDIWSYDHTALGFVAANSDIGPLIYVVFTIYQLWEPELTEAKLGDFIEFGIGIMLGVAVNSK
jgi:hypothetical protein